MDLKYLLIDGQILLYKHGINLFTYDAYNFKNSYYTANIIPSYDIGEVSGITYSSCSYSLRIQASNNFIIINGFITFTGINYSSTSEIVAKINFNFPNQNFTPADYGFSSIAFMSNTSGNITRFNVSNITIYQSYISIGSYMQWTTNDIAFSFQFPCTIMKYA